MMSISEAAKTLGVNKKTLMRWDSEKKFVAERDTSGARIYDEDDINKHAQWFALRRKHRAHNRELGAIRSAVDQLLVTQPLETSSNPKFHSLEEMKHAFEALRKWEKENWAILDEYSNLPRNFKARVDPDA